MDLAKSIEPVTALKSRSAELIRQARETGRPIVITQNGRATAVLQDIESFESQRKALLLLKFMVQGDQELADGKGVSHADADTHFKAKLRELSGG